VGKVVLHVDSSYRGGSPLFVSRWNMVDLLSSTAPAPPTSAFAMQPFNHNNYYYTGILNSNNEPFPLVSSYLRT